MAAPHSAGMMMMLLLLLTMMCACHLQSVQSMELRMTSSTTLTVTAVKISLGSSNDGYPSSSSAAFIHTLIERRRRRQQQQQGNGNNVYGLVISEPLKPVATVVGRIQHSMNDYFPKNHNDRHRNVTMEKDDQLLSSIDNQHVTVSSSIDNRHVKIINIQDDNIMPNDGDENTEERRFKSTLRQGLESKIMNKLERERLLSNILDSSNFIGGGGGGGGIESSATTTNNNGMDDTTTTTTSHPLARRIHLFGKKWLGSSLIPKSYANDRSNESSAPYAPNRFFGKKWLGGGLIPKWSYASDHSNESSAPHAAPTSNDDNIVKHGIASSDTATEISTNNNNNVGARRLLTGLIMALAEEVKDLEIEVNTNDVTPMNEKMVNSIRIYFSRLAFRQLRMGGIDGLLHHTSKLESSSSLGDLLLASKNLESSSKTTTRRRSSSLSSSSSSSSSSGGGSSSFFGNFGKTDTANETFDKIDIDGNGTLDVWELAQALKTVALMGGARLGIRSRVIESLTELSARLVRLYDVNGDGVVDRQEYQMLVRDMAALRYARMNEEEGGRRRYNNGTTNVTESVVDGNSDGDTKKKNWFTSFFNNRKTSIAEIDVTDTTNHLNDEIWDLVEEDDGEGSLVLEGLNLDLRQFLFGSIPGGVKRLLPGGPLILKPFTATLTCSFNRDDIMESILLDSGLRRLVARALSRRVRGVRDLLDGAVFYGRTWKTLEQNAPLVEIAKLENVQFDNRNRLIITGRAKIKEALGYKHDPIEQGFKVRTKIGTRSYGRIIGLLEPEIAIFFECPKEFEMNVRDKFREWFGYTIPVLQPLYTFIPLVSPLKKNDNMDGFNLGEDNQIKFIDIKNGKLLIEFSALLRPGRFLGNHYLAFTVPNRTLILTLDRVKEAMRNARRNKRLAELAAREVTKLQSTSVKPCEYISTEGKARIRRLEEELKATIQEEAILREMKDYNSKTTESEKSFFSRFVEGYVGALRKGVDLKMSARLSTSISDFFGSQDGEINEEEDA